MALSQTRLKAAIVAKLKELAGNPTDDTGINRLAEAISSAVVTEITSNLEALPTNLKDGMAAPVTGSIGAGEFS